MFSKMRDAEAVSRNEMLLTLLRELAFIIVDHPELLDMENADNEGMAATHLAADMLIDYRMWADGMTIEQAQAWLSEPQFITDFGVALDAYGTSVDPQEDNR
jgi:Mlc titration factor MtfA (ptsG expression regulator)